MAINNIRLGGLNSGFDTESMIEQIMSTYQTKIDAQDKKLQKLSWQQEAYQDVTKKLTDFQNKYFDILKRDSYIMSPSSFNKFSSTVKNKATGEDAAGISVSTTSNSREGSYKVSVKQLATATTAEGKSMVPGNFNLDFDKAIANGEYTDTEGEDGAKTRTYDFALDFKVGSVTKTIEFKGEAALDADGKITDEAMTNLKQNMLDNLNKELADSFGLSGREGADATGATNADGKEYFLQVKLDGDKVSFQVGGNTNATVIENKGNFGLAQASEKIAISTSSAVTGKNAVSVEVNGVTKNVEFEGVSASYYDTKDLKGNEAILKEYNALKEAAYRKDNKLSPLAVIDQQKLDDYSYTSTQAAKDKNAAVLNDALNKAFSSEGIKFTIDGSYVTAKKDGKNLAFTMTSTAGGTLGLEKGTASNKFNGKTTLAKMGLATNYTDDKDYKDGAYKLKINGTDIIVNKYATIDSLVSAVNKSDAGVTMTYSALTNSFSIESNELGGAGKVEIEENDITKTFGFESTEGKINVTTGQNAIFTINGEEIYLNDNSYTFDGTTFKFGEESVSTDPANPKEFNIEVSKSYDDVKTLIKDFVKDYNQLVEDVYKYVGTAPKRDNKNNLYEPLTDAEKADMSEDEIKKWEDAAKQGVLYNDSTVSSIMSQIRSALYNSVTLDDGSKFGLFSMGITTSRDTEEHGKLVIDEDKLDAAFANNAEAVTKLFTDSETGIMKKVDGILDRAVKSSGAAKSRGTLIRKAGLEGNSTTIKESSLYKEMLRVQDRISSLQEKYDSREEYWWSVFTNLESMMSDLNSQSSYLSSYLGSGGM